MNRPLVSAIVALLLVLGPAAEALPQSRLDESTMESFTFHSQGTELRLEARNGFEIRHQPGLFKRGSKRTRGGIAVASSPWAEDLRMVYWIDPDALLIRLDESIVIRYTFDRRNRLQEMYVEADGATALSPLGALRDRRSAPEISHLDAYALLAEALRSRHSAAFLRSLEAMQQETGAATAPAGCFSEGLSCSISAAAWLASVGGLASCVSGVLSVTCVVAILGHELASAAVVKDCGLWLDCIRSPEVPEEGPEGNLPSDNTGPSPVIIDLDNDGYHLSGPQPPVLFDLDADGVPERVSWTSIARPDAFLCLDRNTNGVIDDGTELFGDSTPLSTGEVAENGYVALAEFDLPAAGGNSDGRISDLDSIFPSLCVWTDENRDGISQQSEIETLNSAGVLTLGYDFKSAMKRDRFGNLFKYRSSAKILNRAGKSRTIVTYDVFFVTN